MSWDSMEGGEAVRFCEQCKLHVYNLSGIPRVEAEQLVQQTEKRLCVRFFRRTHGTLLTQDCPAGLAAARKKAVRLAGLAAGVLLAATVSALALASGFWRSEGFSVRERVGILRNSTLREVEPFASLLEWLDPSPSVMGAWVVPPPAVGANSEDGEDVEER